MKTIKDHVIYQATAPCLISMCDITQRSNEWPNADDAREDVAHKLRMHLYSYHSPAAFSEFVEVLRVERTIIDNATPVTED